MNPRLNRLKVRKRASKPAGGNKELSTADGLLLDGILCLPLCSDEEEPATLGGQVTGEVVRRLKVFKRLLQIDYVDAVSGPVNESAHLRVPPIRLVAEVAASLEELLHGDD